MIIFPDRFSMADTLFSNDKIGIELGVYEGEYSEHLLSCNPKKLYLLDYWEQYDDYRTDPLNYENLKSAYQLVIDKFADKSNVEIIKKYTHDYVQEVPDGYFDYIYLDANHSYNSVIQDLNDWYPKVKKGGIFAGHDFFESPICPWVQTKRAVLDFFKEVDYITTELKPSWAVQL